MGGSPDDMIYQLLFAGSGPDTRTPSGDSIPTDPLQSLFWSRELRPTRQEFHISNSISAAMKESKFSTSSSCLTAKADAPMLLNSGAVSTTLPKAVINEETDDKQVSGLEWLHNYLPSISWFDSTGFSGKEKPSTDVVERTTSGETLRVEYVQDTKGIIHTEIPDSAGKGVSPSDVNTSVQSKRHMHIYSYLHININPTLSIDGGKLASPISSKFSWREFVVSPQTIHQPRYFSDSFHSNTHKETIPNNEMQIQYHNILGEHLNQYLRLTHARF